jgi:hypothetical protein
MGVAIDETRKYIGVGQVDNLRIRGYGEVLRLYGLYALILYHEDNVGLITSRLAVEQMACFDVAGLVRLPESSGPHEKE